MDFGPSLAWVPGLRNLFAGVRAGAVLSHGPVAHVAAVAAGDLRLEQFADPLGALALYRRALQADHDGVLGPECYAGMAAAHRALGHSDAERNALRKLLTFPQAGPLLRRARQRLHELGAAPVAWEEAP